MTGSNFGAGHLHSFLIKPIIRPEKISQLHDACLPTPATEEAAMFRYLLLLSSVILFEAVPAFSPASQEPAPPPPAQAPTAPAPSSTVRNPVKATADSQAKAKKMYGFDCEMCHAANGNGKTDLAKDMGMTLTDWTDPKVLSAKSDGDLFDIIRKGKDKMPPEEAARAKDDDVWNLVIYVRGLAKNGAVAASQ
jgi:cytochrome c5